MNWPERMSGAIHIVQYCYVNEHWSDAEVTVVLAKAIIVQMVGRIPVAISVIEKRLRAECESASRCSEENSARGAVHLCCWRTLLYCCRARRLLHSCNRFRGPRRLRSSCRLERARRVAHSFDRRGHRTSRRVAHRKCAGRLLLLLRCARTRR